MFSPTLEKIFVVTDPVDIPPDFNGLIIEPQDFNENVVFELYGSHLTEEFLEKNTDYPVDILHAIENFCRLHDEILLLMEDYNHVLYDILTNCTVQEINFITKTHYPNSLSGGYIFIAPNGGYNKGLCCRGKDIYSNIYPARDTDPLAQKYTFFYGKSILIDCKISIEGDSNRNRIYQGSEVSDGAIFAQELTEITNLKAEPNLYPVYYHPTQSKMGYGTLNRLSQLYEIIKQNDTCLIMFTHEGGSVTKQYFDDNFAEDEKGVYNTIYY